jgi:uncharacterized protein
MSTETLSKLADRILEHARDHRLTSISLVLHGGEPLLAGHERLKQYAATLRTKLAEIPTVDLRIHTNGVRLDSEFCAIFDQHGIRVGVSVDGHRAANDLHRKFANGRSSYPFVERALQLLRKDENRHIYAGLLCTVDIANDPIAVYEALRTFEPPRVDFLLPHATWDDPPPLPVAETSGTESAADASTAYADWLIAIFDRWNADARPMAVRFFDSIESLARGGPSQTESLGSGPADLVVIETDGTLEQVDSLKVVGDGAAATGLDVFQHSLDEAAAHPGIAARRQGLDALCSTCLACPVVHICGGGLYTHRFESGSGFENPSVYCASLKKLINHVVEAMPSPEASASQLPGAWEGPACDPLDDAALDDLAAGSASAATIAKLVEAQAELGRDLLVDLREHVDDLPGWDLITRMDEEQPRAFDAVLAHPYVRNWAQECLIASRTQRSARSTTRRLAHLAGIAAAAAIRAGTEAQIDVPVVGGAIHLPTLGALAVDTETAALAVSVDAGGFTAAHERTLYTVRLGLGEPTDARWQPVRRLRAPGAFEADPFGADTFDCVLDDGDPYRDCFAEPPMQRLTDHSITAWRNLFADSWALILRDHAAYAPGIRASINTLTPLTAAGPRDAPLAEKNAFGAVGLALPQDAPAMALALIAASQRMYMRAISDFYDLTDPRDRTLHRASWRRHPRGVSELLLDAYAHVAVTDFWLARAAATEGTPEHPRAATEAARSLRIADEALDMLAAARSVTALGRRFLAALRAKIEPWFAQQSLPAR